MRYLPSDGCLWFGLDDGGPEQRSFLPRLCVNSGTIRQNAGGDVKSEIRSICLESRCTLVNANSLELKEGFQMHGIVGVQQKQDEKNSDFCKSAHYWVIFPGTAGRRTSTGKCRRCGKEKRFFNFISSRQAFMRYNSRKKAVRI